MSAVLASSDSAVNVWQIAGVVVSGLALALALVALAYSMRTRRLVPRPKGEMDIGWDMTVQANPLHTDLFVKFRIHNRGTVPLHVRELLLIEACESDDGKSWEGPYLQVFGPDTMTIEVGGPPAELRVDVLHDGRIDWLSSNGVVAVCELADGEILAEKRLEITDEYRKCFAQPGVHRYILPAGTATQPKARRSRWPRPK